MVIGGTVVVSARGLAKTYARGDEQVHALREVSLDLHPGELVALVGPSGSGKSTLLNVLCGWERPDDGTLDWTEALAGTSPDRLPWGRLAIVPQALGLLEDLSVEENIMLPARLTGRLKELRPRAEELMSGLGIAHLAARYPRQTSLGEQQRCAASRALLLGPTLLLADEPTAHQDRGHADRLLDAVTDAARGGSAVLIATHDELAWARADRVLSMRDGVVTDGPPS
jgi:ABC-type lipoprotein export system ATPase subunit